MQEFLAQRAKQLVFRKLLDDFAEGLADVASLEKEAKVEGRSIAMVLAEKK